MASKEKTEKRLISNAVHVVAGGKGGVGKSLFSIALIDYLATRFEAQPFVFDSDSSNPDVFKAYRDKITALKAASLDVDRGWEHLADAINENPTLSIVVNTGARNSDGVTKFGSMLLDTVKDLKRLLFTWWVINGEIDSITLLKRYAATMPGHPVHVVLNQRDENTSFAPWNADDDATKKLRDDLAALGGKVVTVPMLGAHLAEELRNKRLTLDELLKGATYGKRISISGWRSKVAEALDVALGTIPKDP